MQPKLRVISTKKLIRNWLHEHETKELNKNKKPFYSSFPRLCSTLNNSRNSSRAMLKIKRYLKKLQLFMELAFQEALQIYWVEIQFQRLASFKN